MRILQISKKLPYPQKDGESIAIYNLASTLVTQGVTIDLLTLNTNKHYTDPTVALSKLTHYDQIEIIPHQLKLSAVQAIKHIIQSDSYNIERFISSALSQKLIELLTSHVYDVIILETLYVSHYIEVIRQHSAALIVMRAHNIEHHIWQEIARLEKQVVKKRYLEHLAQSLERYEVEQIVKYDAVLTVASDDYDWYAQHIEEQMLLLNPIGLDTKKYAIYAHPDDNETKEAYSFGFIGALDWIPNAEGLTWFLENVWPQVHTACPQAQFHIAGRNMPDVFKELTGAGIVVHGEVDSAVAFMSSFDVMVAPLFIASGIRVKILEAMALAKVVVTTSIALKGNHAIDNRDVIIANTASEFIAKMTTLCNDNGAYSSIGESAMGFVNDHFNQEKLTTELIEHINKLQQRKIRLS